MTDSTRLKLFLSVCPGLESVLMAELASLSAAERIHEVQGGCEVRVSRTGVWDVVLGSRIAESSRVRIGAFRARDFSGLAKGIAKLPWAAWLPRGSKPEVRVACKKSKLWHSGAVQERVENQIWERLSLPGKATTHPPAARVYVRVDHDKVQVSIDASGDLLHRRGERTSVGRAPMRETLAAAVVRASGSAPEVGVWDAFCGSGTLLLESGRVATGGLTARAEGYAFELWPGHDAEAYAAWLSENAEKTGAQPVLFGSDREDKEIAAAKDNLAAAGLEADLRSADFAEAAKAIPRGVKLVSNLPYGRRSELGGTLKRFGLLLRQRRDIDAWLLLGHASHAQAIGLRGKPVVSFLNGGIRVGLYHRPGA
ncbi:MAG: hypothetical protein KC502_13870 [Myxococcales bacterium]|nr:hypothetical protein [Myxococcales bacterium]